MAGHDLIVVGASAGGVEALKSLVTGLPPAFPAAVAIVLHIPPNSPSVLPRVLGRHCALEVRHPSDGEALRPGTVYVAPPDHHMLVERRCLRLGRGPRENGFRPAIDPLFRSAALSYGSRVIGVVLSGTLDDGTIGLATIIDAGGIAVVQDPEDALYPSMPESAIEHVRVDHVAPAAELPALLTRLVAEPAPPDATGKLPDEAKIEVEVAEMDPDAIERSPRPGRPSGFGCPECGGSLFLIDDYGVMHFRCRVGHAWSMESLLAAQGSALEAALWTALRALEEQTTLADQIAARLRKRGSNASAQRFEEQATDAREHARVIRAALEQRRSATVRGARPASVARSPASQREDVEESARAERVTALARWSPRTPL